MQGWNVLRVLAIGLVSVVGLVRIYNRLVELRNRIANAFGQIDVQLKRRHDLVPNLVATVQAYAAHEKDVFTQVAQARASVGGIQATPELINDSAAFAKFQSAQAEMTSAIARLLVVAENYPQLKADANFRDLQAQLEGTENRVTVARNRYIDAVRTYNVSVRTFPNNLTAMVMGWQPKANFSVDNEKAISDAPSVNFGSK
jgi:LemA protein